MITPNRQMETPLAITEEQAVATGAIGDSRQMHPKTLTPTARDGVPSRMSLQRSPLTIMDPTPMTYSRTYPTCTNLQAWTNSKCPRWGSCRKMTPSSHWSRSKSTRTSCITKPLKAAIRTPTKYRISRTPISSSNRLSLEFRTCKMWAVSTQTWYSPSLEH